MGMFACDSTILALLLSRRLDGICCGQLFDALLMACLIFVVVDGVLLVVSWFVSLTFFLLLVVA